MTIVCGFWLSISSIVLGYAEAEVIDCFWKVAQGKTS